MNSVAKSSVARANNNRSYKIFQDLFYVLLEQCQAITPKRNFSFDNPLYSLDSTTIRLCLSLCDWAKYRHAKGAVKMHTLINNRTDIPEVVNISIGDVNDLTAARKLEMSIPLGSFLVFDRGYLDFKWWNTLHEKGIFFVTRPKKVTLFVVSGKYKEPGGRILADDRVWIGDILKAEYLREMRRVKYLNDEGEVYVYVTNNFVLSGEEIALIYRERWRIELFFKWIKQNLKIKSFLGTSKNAVMSQIWVAMTYYLILSYIKFQTKFDRSLLELTRMVEATLFTRRTLIDLLSLSSKTVHKFKVPEVTQLRFTGV